MDGSHWRRLFYIISTASAETITLWTCAGTALLASAMVFNMTLEAGIASAIIASVLTLVNPLTVLVAVYVLLVRARHKKEIAEKARNTDGTSGKT